MLYFGEFPSTHFTQQAIAGWKAPTELTKFGPEQTPILVSTTKNK